MWNTNVYSKRNDRKVGVGMKDGVALFYIKDDTVYPVILSTEQNETLQFLVNVITGGKPLKVLDKPMGEAYNLVDDIKAKEMI